MANVYVRSGAGGAGTGADWANAYTTLAAALAAKAAGDDFWVSDDHAESTAGAVTLTSPGTAASPCRIICVDHNGSVPPVSADLRTTATVATTGANSIAYAGFAISLGVSYTAGNSTNNASLNFTSGATWWWRVENATLTLGGNNASGRLLVGASNNVAQKLELVNVICSFANASQLIQVTSARLDWRTTSNAIAGTAPTVLFGSPTRPSSVNIIGVDLSALGSGKSIFTVSGASYYECYLTDCKLGASVSITTGSITGEGGPIVRVVNSDSGNTNYRYYYQDYKGTITQETTIVRSGGASDGTMPFSRKMVTTANSKFYSSLCSDWCYYWNDATGSSKTIAFATVTDNVTLKDNEAWIEVEGLGTSGFPLGTFSSDAAADVLNAGANQTTDGTSSWTTTGLGTPVKQVLSTTITPQLKGLIRARVCLAKASTTMYFDPCPLDGSFAAYKANQYMAADGIFGERASAAAAGSIVINRRSVQTRPAERRTNSRPVVVPTPDKPVILPGKTRRSQARLRKRIKIVIPPSAKVALPNFTKKQQSKTKRRRRSPFKYPTPLLPPLEPGGELLLLAKPNRRNSPAKRKAKRRRGVQTFVVEPIEIPPAGPVASASNVARAGYSCTLKVIT